MTDFEQLFAHQAQITTICVIYKRPDFNHLLQEFTWQALDIPPQFRRMKRFLTYWRNEIRVPIVHVELGVAGVMKPISWNSPTVFEA